MKTPTLIERHFRPTEIARMLGLSTATVRRKISARELDSRKVGRAVMVPASALERFLAVKGS